MAKLASAERRNRDDSFQCHPAFDLLPASEDLNTYFAETYEENLSGIDPQRAELYKICERPGRRHYRHERLCGRGRLFSAQTSPFGTALTPVQCIHYALTRPGVASILAGYDTPEHVKAAVAYETASAEEKDYASVLAKAPHHALQRSMYILRPLRAMSVRH